MTCNCVCQCQRKAEGIGRYPTLCDVCGLSVALNSSKCGLPYEAPKLEKLEPLEPISDAAKDKAIETAMEGLI